MAQDSTAVLYRAEDGIAEIRFNRPDRLNALNLEVAHGFARAVDQAVGDPAIRVIVLCSEGRAFMAGGDLSFFQRSHDKRAAAYELIEPIHGALKALAAAPQVVVGAVQGAAAGAGMSLALGVDLLIAADDATFNLAYAAIGASPDCGGSWALARLVGVRKALEIALLCETIDAQEALRLGLVNRVVPRGALQAETAKLAARLAAGAPVAQGRIRHLIRNAPDRTYAEQLDAESEGFAACAQTQDFAGAIDAFFAKRKPRFVGR